MCIFEDWEDMFSANGAGGDAQTIQTIIPWTGKASCSPCITWGTQLPTYVLFSLFSCAHI